MDEWYLLRSKPRQELRAVENLERQGFIAYCPMLEQKRAKPEPLFPGYVFLQHEDFDEHPEFGKIRSTRGVGGFVKFGEDFAKLPDDLVDGIRRQEDAFVVCPLFKPGQLVEFSDGPFKDMQAVYQFEKGADRCMVLISILNRPSPVVAHIGHLKKA